jgi:hypothetical protein
VPPPTEEGPAGHTRLKTENVQTVDGPLVLMTDLQPVAEELEPPQWRNNRLLSRCRMPSATSFQAHPSIRE